jgi:isopentenyl-diphosphate delta-isomerase
MEKIILVDEFDSEIGTMEKMEAHRKGVLHRAFSVMLFNTNGELLLQRRARKKYHSGGLWTNTCCSHPLPQETIEQAARRRLKQEMGIDLHPTFAFKFIYKADLDQNLIEHEFDHVFIGVFDGLPEINKEEVEDWKFMNLDLLRKDIKQFPDAYTTWLKLIINHPEWSTIEV